jgi:tetratricopeptide (TPR) repeat protein
LRVRAGGFQERTVALLPGQRGRVAVRLTRTTDEAELTFQRAEEAREKASGEEANREAAELYRRALELRPNFPAAHVGLARVLLALNEYDAALDEIDRARRDRPVYPEASAVEGRIQRMVAFTDASIESYERAIREARGFQPEAYAGLGIALEEKGEYEEAAKAFRKAIAQLSDTEPALYQLLGAVYERQEKYKEAVEAYEKYLQLAPEGRLAPAIRSIIDSLRQQAAEQGTQPD